MDAILAGLLLDLSGLSDDDAEELAYQKYAELYLDQGLPSKRMGVRATHDGQEVLFFDDRFEHAFYETTGWYRKGTFDRRRGERVAWVGPVIAGEIKGTECWLVPPKNGKRDVRGRPWNRLYVVQVEAFVVWLEPRQKGGWKFSSAYVAGHGDIRRYQRAGRCLWP